jgi:xanthine dehydrogenase accessory factor
VVAPGAASQQFPEVDVLRQDLDLGQFKITPETFIVVSTQGDGDEEALALAARSSAAYVAFVASKVKAHKVLDSVLAAGVPPERVRQVRAPAGLDIRAALPEEIAVSILAEIIRLRGSRAKAGPGEEKVPRSVMNQEAKDPVCGMIVSISTAKYKSDHNGSPVYFCCAGCKQAFDRQPEKYMVAQSG